MDGVIGQVAFLLMAFMGLGGLVRRTGVGKGVEFTCVVGSSLGSEVFFASCGLGK